MRSGKLIHQINLSRDTARDAYKSSADCNPDNLGASLKRRSLQLQSEFRADLGKHGIVMPLDRLGQAGAGGVKPAPIRKA